MVTDPSRTAGYSRHASPVRRERARASGRRLFLTLLTVLIFGVSACGPKPAASPAAEGEVVFSDPSLEAAVREAIDKAEGPISSSDLETLVSLSVPGRGIIDLTGLEYCTNLTSLDLSGNEIGSIAPLTALTSLTDLRLGDNQIGDVSPLAPLIRLKWLFLSNNQIANLSPLRSLTRLNELWLDGNQIGNVSALAALSKLDVLRLHGNRISDVSPLASLADLTELWLHENQISDISALASLIRLTYLRLSDNQIGSILALAPLDNLIWLHLDSNQIRNVAPLASLSKLTHLYLSNNQIGGVASLDSLAGLIVLWLDGNQIGNVSPLASLTALTDLVLDGNQMGDITPLSAIPGLRPRLVVTFPDQNLEAAVREAVEKPEGPLYTTDLEATYSLNVSGKGITDLTGIEYLTSLRSLVASTNQISDVSPLASLTDLTTLVLSSNQISDISPLASLTNLTDLFLGANQISDVSPLVTLTKLTELWLQGNPIDDTSSLTALISMTSLDPDNGGDSAVFPDENLEAAVREATGKPEGPIYAADLEALTSLSVPGRGIINLTGLDRCVNLERLELHDNQISDLSPLADLTSLTELRLGDNQISNVSPLASLTSLTRLFIGGNQIGDVSPLAHLRGLTELWLNDNQLADISPLADLTNLRWLYLNGNQITDVTPVTYIAGLLELWVYDNPIADTSPLASLAGVTVLGEITFPDSNLEAAVREAIDKSEGRILTSDLVAITSLSLPAEGIVDLTGLEYFLNLKRLELGDNQISDLSPLAHFRDLTELRLNDNRIADMSPLAGLTSLTTLWLEGNQIGDVSSLVSLTNLTELWLNDNQIIDIEPLADLTGLTALWLQDNRITDVGPLADLAATTRLWLQNNPLEDVSPLFPDPNLEDAVREAMDIPKGPILTSDLETLKALSAGRKEITNLSGLEYCVNLEWLDANGNQISDISPLASLTALTELWLNDNQIIDISPLADLGDLTELRLQNNQIDSISRLSSLTTLAELLLDDNQISDISPLVLLRKLSVLWLQNNRIADISPLADLSALTWLHLNGNEITDIGTLAGNTKLTELRLGENRIAGVSPLASLTDLTRLSLHGNRLEDISPLASLVDLTWLTLYDNPISDVSPLASLTNLDRLVLGPDQTDEDSPLPPLPGATVLWAVVFPDQGLEAAIREAIRRAEGPVYTLELAGLTSLSVPPGDIADLSGLEHLVNLRRLEIAGNAISDLSPLASLTDLTQLSLDDNRIVDLLPLASLTNLTELSLSDNRIADLSPLESLTGLTVLHLDGNAMSTDSYSFTTQESPPPLLPYTSGHDPARGATGIPADASIIVHLLDDGSGVDRASISMTVDGTAVTPAITGSPADYILSYDPPANFAPGQEVDVTVDTRDLDGNAMSTDSYSFKATMMDGVTPYTSGHGPAEGTTGIPANTSIVVHVRDDDAGVDLDSISMTVEGATVTPIIDGVPADYTLTYDPPADFASLQVVDVTIGASDLDGNRMVTDSYSFTTQEPRPFLPPYTAGHDPARGVRGATDIPADASIVVHVLDDGSGVDLATISMTVEGASVTPTITGSPADYTLTYDPPDDFALYQLVDVTVDARDLDGNIMATDAYSFNIAMIDSVTPYTSGHDPADEAIGVLVDSDVVVHVADDGSGVDRASISMTVDGTGVTPTITGSPADYTLSYDPPDDFTLRQVVNVTVDARDLDGNTMPTDSYAFTMIDDSFPYTSGHGPASGATGIPVDSNIIVHVVDDDAGVDLASILMTVEGVSVTPTITGSPADYTLTYDPPDDFDPLQVVDVTVDASDLDGNQINDLLPLSSLTGLTELYLHGNQIVDISPLALLSNLTELTLESDWMNDPSLARLPADVDVSWVVAIPDPNLETALRESMRRPEGPIYTSDLEALTSLSLSERGIADLAGLEYAVNLERLEIDGNQISDVSPLASLPRLRELWLHGNPIEEIAPLASLHGLTELVLAPDQIDDMSPLASLAALSIRLAVVFADPNLELAVREALGKPEGPIYDRDLIDLVSLSAGRRGIASLAGLEYCLNLRMVDIDGNQVSDLSPLAGLASLTRLRGSGNQISDISPLALLTNLTELDLGNNQISDISPLSGLVNLTSLELSDNQIGDISPLVTNQVIGDGDTLHIRFNPLNAESSRVHILELEARGATVFVSWVVVSFPDPNLEAAVRQAVGRPTGDILSTDLEALTSLDISGLGISDLTGLEQCRNLTSLDLRDNQISDISPLVLLTNLTELELEAELKAELEAALAAAAEEAAAAEAAAEEAAAAEAAAAEAAATEELAPPEPSFDALTWIDETYGFSIQYLSYWTDGEDYGQYERLGDGAYAIPALSIALLEELITDYRASIVEGEAFLEMLSETPAVLVDGTAVTLYEYEYSGDYPGWSLTMYVEINRTGFTFTVQDITSLPLEDHLAVGTEILLSLVID